MFHRCCTIWSAASFSLPFRSEYNWVLQNFWNFPIREIFWLILRLLFLSRSLKETVGSKRWRFHIFLFTSIRWLNKSLVFEFPCPDIQLHAKSQTHLEKCKHTYAKQRLLVHVFIMDQNGSRSQLDLVCIELIYSHFFFRFLTQIYAENGNLSHRFKSYN